MRILVTGGAGYLGSVLCPMLLEQGHDVRILDVLMWGVKPILHFVTHPRLEVVRGEIRDQSTIASAVKDVDCVVHLASIVGYPACHADPINAESVNVDGTRSVVEAMSPSQRLIFASTGSTYGKIIDGICDETKPINPVTLYGRSKRDGEQIVDDFGGVRLRLATVFGASPRMRLDLLVNDFCYMAHHMRQIVLFEGHLRRTFLHCRDAAFAFAFAVEHYDRMKGDVFNVGSSSMNYTKRDVADAIMAMHPYYLHEADVGKDLDERDYEVSYDKLNALGYEATITLDEGIRELLRVVPLLQITNEWRNA